MAKKTGLGKGLGALIEDNNTHDDSSSSLIKEIELSKIETNPYQPRKYFDEEALKELSESIKLLGIIQPITLRKIDGEDRYQLISGERRFRASKLANLTTIPSYVRTANDQGMLEMALVENIQREDLDAIEVALSFQQLLTECKLTQELLSERVGKKRSTVTNYLRLLKLPPEIQLGIKTRQISMGHARALINIEDAETQLMVYEQILKYNFSVRKTEEIVRELTENTKLDKIVKNKQKTPTEYQSLETHLSNYFKTKVDFKINDNGKGKIVIDFKSTEDLERIIEIIDKI
jgi:ParB family chromosome partitioning protein